MYEIFLEFYLFSNSVSRFCFVFFKVMSLVLIDANIWTGMQLFSAYFYFLLIHKILALSAFSF